MHEVALTYMHFDTVAGTTLDSLVHLVMADALGPRLIGPVHVSSVPSLGVIEGANQLAEALLESDAEWVFWVDCDMGFAPDTLQRLMLAADPDKRPCVSALTFKYQQTHTNGLGGFLCEPRPVLLDWGVADDGREGFVGRRTYPENTLVQVDATGMACALIHRRVYEDIRDKFSRREDGTVDETWADWHSPLRTPPGSAAKQLGPDVSFWLRARMAGHPLLVHTGVDTCHQKTTWLSHASFEALNPDWKATAPAEGATVEPFPAENRAERRRKAKERRKGPPQPKAGAPKPSKPNNPSQPSERGHRLDGERTIVADEQ